MNLKDEEQRLIAELEKVSAKRIAETQQYIDKLKAAHEFYSQSPDGQYDLFVCDVIANEYFALTGEGI